jgi:hypothetical protein
MNEALHFCLLVEELVTVSAGIHSLQVIITILFFGQ